MAKLLKPSEEVKKAIDARIRAGKDLTAKAEIAENTGGYVDWLFIFAKWREETAAELTTLYQETDIGQEFTAITQTGEYSSPRFTFPHRKSALELGLFWLDRLIGRLELAVWESPDAMPIESLTASNFGLPDRRAFLERMKTVEGSHKLTSVLFFDLDNFKAVNDEFGHNAGDKVIEEAIVILQEALRGKGELFHRSGDEMLILLPNFAEDEACAVAERIRTAIHQNEFPTIGSGRVTATIGLATYPTTCADLAKLEDTADQAMLAAKKRGKKNSIARSILPKDNSTASPQSG